MREKKESRLRLINGTDRGGSHQECESTLMRCGFHIICTII
jgi:hypothetical protein